MTLQNSQIASSDSLTEAGLPVVVIGAGPVGLAGAAHLAALGLEPLILEAGETVGASVLQWGHVKMFSPWRYNIDQEARRLLEEGGWTAPDPDALPTGRELVEQYLEPLAATPALASRIRLGAKVIAVGRRGFDKVKTFGREEAPFRVSFERTDGEIETIEASAVIDATGTWKSPNPIGAGGIPATGERAARERVYYGIPDVLDRDRERYAGRRALVVGAGHSAMNALLDLAALRREDPSVEVFWAVRRDVGDIAWGGGDKDALSARGALGTRLRNHVEAGDIQVLAPFSIETIQSSEEGLKVRSADSEIEVDEIVATTGSRPDLSFLREVRLDLDPALESTKLLAPLIDPNVHSCGTVRPHGERELRQPEDGFYIAGMKSYGRAPTFLLATGHEQMRSIASALAGDRDAADRVELCLPETGVCSSDLAHPEPAAAAESVVQTSGACCGGGGR